MKKYEVMEGKKSHGFFCAESAKEAIRQARMWLFAHDVKIGDDGWWVK